MLNAFNEKTEIRWSGQHGRAADRSAFWFSKKEYTPRIDYINERRHFGTCTEVLLLCWTLPLVLRSSSDQTDVWDTLKHDKVT